jgi:hypothetical protein
MGRKRKNQSKSKATETPEEVDDDVQEQFAVNDDWENSSPFPNKKDGDHDNHDNNEEVGANVTQRNLSGTEIDCLSGSSKTTESETDLSALSREKLQERFDDQQEEIKELQEPIFAKIFAEIIKKKLLPKSTSELRASYE